MKAIRIYKSGIHLGEEPLILGNHASGLITFSGCHLACHFCYTPETSVHRMGNDYSPQEFSRLIEELVARGARNLNLISPTHLWNQLTRPLLQVKFKYGKLLPILLKVSGYEVSTTAKSLAHYGDVLIPDFKVWTSSAAKAANLPENYGPTCLSAIEQWMASHGDSHFSQDGKLSHGMVIRHLLMPEQIAESIEVVEVLGRIGYRGFINFMTYFADPVKRTLANANPHDVRLLYTLAEGAGMQVLVNGRHFSSLSLSQNPKVRSQNAL